MTDESDYTIAFVYETPSSFIIQDLRILSNMFRVVAVQWVGVASIVKVLLAVLHCDIVFAWWVTGQASTMAFVFAKAFRKKTIFVPGGSEVALNRDIHGSDPRSAIRFLLARIIIRFADCVIPVSEFTLREVLAISAPKRYRVVYNAIDTHRYILNHRFRKELNIVSVAMTRDPRGFRIKGLDRYAKLSKALPNFSFYLVGPASADPRVRRLFSPGVCVGLISQDELLSFYQKAIFYCQLSRYESFGAAVAEAMACECVPVVSDSGALPEVVGNCGIIVHDGDPLVAARLIRESLPRTGDLGSLGRKRILSEFNVKKRSFNLQEVILTLILSKKGK